MAVNAETIRKAREAGYNDNQIKSYIANSEEYTKAKSAGYDDNAIYSHLGFKESVKEPATFTEKAKAVGRAAMPYVRPLLEGGGAVGGAILGTPAGLAGNIGGGALGYAAGAKASDILESAVDGNVRPQPTTATGQIGQSLSDIGTGATFEMGGQIAGQLLGMGIKGVQNASMGNRAKKRAAELLSETSNLTPREQINFAEASKLANKLKTKLTPAQMTGKPELAALEQGLSTADSSFAAVLNMQDSSAKKAALGQIRAKVGKGKPLPATQDLQTTGSETVAAVKAAQAEAKPVHEALYDAIPNTPLPTDKIQNVISNLKKTFRTGDEEVFPSRAIARVEEAIKPEPVAKPTTQILDQYGQPIPQASIIPKSEIGFQDLHSLRKDIGRQIQDASTGAKPNRELAAKLTMIKNSIDDTIESTMGTDNQYKAAKNAFIDYADKFRTGAVNKVMQKGQESSGLRLADENIPRQFFTPSGANGLIKAVGLKTAKEQMKPFVMADMIKTAAPDGVNYNVQSGINYIQKNRAVLEKLGLADEAKQVLKTQIPQELEKMLAKRAPDVSGQQFFTSQDMRGILQKYGNTIKQLYGPETLNAFREYNQLMGMIERKNLVPRGSGSNTADKAMNVANLMIKEATGPAAKLTDGLIMAMAKGAGLGGGAGLAAGGGSLKTAAIIGTLNTGRQLIKNADNQVAHAFVKILQDATINPQIARDLMRLSKTGKVPATLQTIIDKHLIGGTTLAATGD